MNVCEVDVLAKLQQQKDYVLYDIDDVIAIMDIGNYRKRQEDSLLITKHQKYPEKELLIVADGVGGAKNGDLASNITVTEMYFWFQDLNKNDLNNFQIEFNKFLDKLDMTVKRKSYGGGSTLVAAFTDEEKALLFNIGDSRGYIYNNEELKQVTNDDSYAQRMYETGKIKDNEEMRFYKKSNIITSYLGINYNKLINVKFHEIDKKDIEKIFLCSDGVSDCISKQTFEDIVKTSNNPCKDIINHVLTTDSFYPYISPEYDTIIKAGKDNATLACKTLTKKR